MIKQYKNIIILAAAILIVAVSAIAVPRIIRHKKAAAPAAEIAPVSEATESIAAVPAEKTPEERQKAYDAVLAAYKTKTITLGEKCSVTIPVDFTVAKGAQVLVTNTASVRQTLDLTGPDGVKTSVAVGPSRYTFRTLQETVKLGCNNLTTAAVVTVQD